MRLAKITLATLVTAALLWGSVLAFSSGVVGQKIDINPPKLQSTQQKLDSVNLEYDKLNAESSRLRSSDKDRIEELNKQKQQLEQERQELQRQLQSKAEEKARLAQAAQDAINKATLTQTASAAPLPPGSRQDWMAAAGIAPSDYEHVDFIVSHEGGWNGTTKWNYAGSGAYGLCQSLPASKMATAGADYMTNPITQLKWCNSYAISRYGSWANAHNFWINNHWW